MSARSRTPPPQKPVTSRPGAASSGRTAGSNGAPKWRSKYSACAVRSVPSPLSSSMRSDAGATVTRAGRSDSVTAAESTSVDTRSSPRPVATTVTSRSSAPIGTSASASPCRWCTSSMGHSVRPTVSTPSKRVRARASTPSTSTWSIVASPSTESRTRQKVGSSTSVAATAPMSPAPSAASSSGVSQPGSGTASLLTRATWSTPSRSCIARLQPSAKPRLRSLRM